MKIAIVGTGYVGLVSGLCFAEFGFETLCIDKDQSRLNSLSKGVCPFFEPGLDDLLIKHLNSKFVPQKIQSLFLQPTVLGN